MNLLPDAVAYLQKRVERDVQSDRVSASLVAWLLPDVVDINVVQNRVSSITTEKASQRNYREIGELAFASECNLLSENGQAVLSDGLRWLSGRSPRISGYPADFCTDAVRLFGFALATRRNGLQAESEWLRNACKVASQQTSGWQSSLVNLTSNLIGGTETIECPEVKVFASSKGIIRDQLTPEDKSQVVNSLKASTLADVESSHAVFLLAAIRHIETDQPRIAIRDVKVTDVAALLREVPRGLERWTWENNAKTSTTEPRKWHIDHEYHVQNLVWFLLSTCFPDARYEENKSAVGTVHPRLDIVIPSLKLVVEVKFWRKPVKSEKMIRELAEDASLYFTADCPYTTLLPFIWDEAARTEEYPLLISGLKEINRIVDAVVIARPAKMS